MTIMSDFTKRFLKTIKKKDFVKMRFVYVAHEPKREVK